MRKPKQFALQVVVVRLALSLLVCFAALQVGSFAQESQPKDGRYYEQQAIRAYREKNYAAFLENMKQAASLRPNHSRLMYNLAVAYALNGKQEEAINWLDRVAQMGLIYPADKDEDFATLQNSPAFKLVLQKFQDNKAPLIRSTTAFTIHEKGLVPESVAYDSVTGTFYLSSVYQRKILSIDRQGRVKIFAAEQDGLWSVMGMKVDAARRHLWVTTAAHPQMANYKPEENGNSAVLKFDLRSQKLIKRYDLPNKPVAHWLGDLLVDSQGDVFATDSISPAIYVIRRQKDEIEAFITGEPFASLQGLTLTADEKSLFVADYAKGIFVINLSTKKLDNLSPPTNATLLGIDGLYMHKGNLIAVQNGVNPQRLVRLILNKDATHIERLEVIEANHPLHDEPTLGVLVKDTFYYIANSQWGAIDKNGHLAAPDKLLEPVVLKVKL